MDVVRPAKRQRLDADPDDVLPPSLAQLDALLQCPACARPYTQYPPLIAGACGHVACSLCVRRHVAERSECVTCRQQTEEALLSVSRALADVANAWWTAARSEALTLSKKVIESRHLKERLTILENQLDTTRIGSSVQTTHPVMNTKKTEPKNQEDVIDVDEDEDKEQQLKPSDKVACPLCTSMIRYSRLNSHIDAGCPPPDPEPQISGGQQPSSGLASIFKRDASALGYSKKAPAAKSVVPKNRIRGAEKSEAGSISTEDVNSNTRAGAPHYDMNQLAPSSTFEVDMRDIRMPQMRKTDFEETIRDESNNSAEQDVQPDLIEEDDAPEARQPGKISAPFTDTGVPSRAAASLTSAGKPSFGSFCATKSPPRRLPPPVLPLLTGPQLRAHLRRHGLSLEGARSQQGRRLQEFVTRWNANLDLAQPRPRRKVVEEIANWEKTTTAGVAGGLLAILEGLPEGKLDPGSSEFDPGIWKRKYAEDYADLVEKARATLDKYKRTFSDGNISEEEIESVDVEEDEMALSTTEADHPNLDDVDEVLELR
ncbi:hypothetical protein M427DRAFT_226717 [Gonapodya prolifera JEL478]|uniref:RING-type domain-containing protein n=1 Tax=Gonapodya prolifera (strain JEL478) TaxID=1344416 RepID=A0A139ANG8_GONPJ|nr:hypothetical protein M427DRAFT_226717 [Gonapodya prolifera JEL478]|eukprot:KXS18297.1 hypothetical protein M427DRAFT_226717 [Gonapodya prolifera JEL478]